MKKVYLIFVTCDLSTSMSKPGIFQRVFHLDNYLYLVSARRYSREDIPTSPVRVSQGSCPRTKEAQCLSHRQFIMMQSYPGRAGSGPVSRMVRVDHFVQPKWWIWRPFQGAGVSEPVSVHETPQNRCARYSLKYILGNIWFWTPWPLLGSHSDNSVVANTVVVRTCSF